MRFYKSLINPTLESRDRLIEEMKKRLGVSSLFAFKSVSARKIADLEKLKKEHVFQVEEEFWVFEN